LQYHNTSSAIYAASPQSGDVKADMKVIVLKLAQTTCPRNQTMKNFLITLSVLLSIFFLNACGSAPKRSPYDGTDQVGAVDTAGLVGNWRMSILNPVGEENANTITQSFNQDGTWESVVIPPAEQTNQFGALEYKGYGNWQVNGDVIVSNLEKMEETTGNKFGGLMQAIVSALVPKTSSANVYEQSASRMILVHEGTGQATLFERI